jgi:hypothetical protein
VRIAGRYHNPPYGLFTVVTFMPRVQGEQQAESFEATKGRRGESSDRGSFYGPDKTEEESD